MSFLKQSFSEKPLVWSCVSVLAVIVFISGCDHPIEPSPQPGVLKVTLQHAPEDTTIQMGGQSDHLSDNDLFPLTISEGRVIRTSDSAYANLFQNMEAFRQQDQLIDVLNLQSDGTPVRYQIFETRIPPAKYTEISFVINTSTIRLVPEGERPITQPVELPPGEQGLVEVDADFQIKEQRTTVVNLRLKSFSSLDRFRDTFRFVPQLSVHSIQQP